MKYSYCFDLTLERFPTKEGPAASPRDIRHSPKATHRVEQVHTVHINIIHIDNMRVSMKTVFLYSY